MEGTGVATIGGRHFDTSFTPSLPSSPVLAPLFAMSRWERLGRFPSNDVVLDDGNRAARALVDGFIDASL